MPKSRSNDPQKRPEEKSVLQTISDFFKPEIAPKPEKSGQKNVESQLDKLRKQGDL